MTNQTCISEQELQAFVLGELPDEAACRVTEHLEACPTCESAAARLETSRASGLQRELARLEDPNQEIDTFHRFTPDSTRLITVSNGKEGGIHVWDLRAIRRRLKEMGLDWDAADLPPEPASPQTPLRLEVIP